MKHLDHNAVQRSLNLMGFALADRTLKKRHSADAYRLAEVQLQHQIAVEGDAGVGTFKDFDPLKIAGLQHNQALTDFKG